MAEVSIPATSFWTFTGEILLLFIEWVVAFCRVCIGTWVLINTCASYTWIISTKIFDNTDTIVLNVEVFAAEKRIIGPHKSIMLRVIQSKLFITSLVITEFSISDMKLLGTDLVPFIFHLFNRIFT